MTKMTSATIRQKYLDYLQAQAHVIVERAPLMLKDDPTTLFTSSGMQPLLPYLLGEPHPAGQRLVDSQVCLRTQDIDEVGDLSHTTCFEMLGNWSLGDYFKNEQLPWFFNFLVDIVGLDVNRLYVTCFRGEAEYDIAKDEDSAAILQELYRQKGIDAKIVDLQSADHAAEVGMDNGRIFYYDDAENWWSRGGGISQTPMGDPAGGDCEFFFDFGDQYHDEARFGKPHPASDSGRFSEIGNSVFMEYRRTPSGFEPLKNKNVDFGGGLERITAAAANELDVFKIDLLWPLVEKLSSLTSVDYQAEPVNFRIIADHMRAVTWLALDGVRPTNKEHGYVMRRLLRRACLKATQLGIETSLSDALVPVVGQIYQDVYAEFQDVEAQVGGVLRQEEKTFQSTLKSGVREFQKLTHKGNLDGSMLFKLFDTYGFPKELSLEEADKQNVTVTPDALSEFAACMQQQRQRSQTIAAGDFKGGLVDHEPMTIKHHTATHLMYKALRLVLGDTVQQRGCSVTSDKIRFDFSYERKVDKDELARVAQIVNQQIAADLPVNCAVMPTGEALEAGALGAFGDKYGPTVKVYTVGQPDAEPYSKEICGGPHVATTSELGQAGKVFTILKEESCAAGIRRIKAALQTAA